MRTEPEDVATVMTSPSRLWTVPRIVCGVAGAVGGEEVVDGVGGDDLWLQAWRENAAASNAETMAHRRCLLYLFTSLNSDFAFQVGMESSFMSSCVVWGVRFADAITFPRPCTRYSPRMA